MTGEASGTRSTPNEFETKLRETLSKNAVRAAVMGALAAAQSDQILATGQDDDDSE